MLRTRSKVRVLGRDDLPAVRRVLDQDPVTYVFVDHRVRATRLDPRWLGGEVWGYDEGAGVVALCHAAANLIPVAAGPDALRAFATQALAQGRRCSAILGPHDDVQQLWGLLGQGWGPARDIRPRQPFLTLDAEPLVRPDPQVRRVRPDELDVLYPACVAMFTEELGVSPEAGGGARLYRSRVAQLISKGLAFALIEGDEVIFKAEVAAVTPHAGQIQGVWVNPAYRGRGLSAPAVSSVASAVLRDLAPLVSLYVNEHNEAARRAYDRVGFVERTRFATVLF
ncbi:MAG: GNAT family N-acetyltransferase [Nocardioidaceae bacterium]